jgi:hypothetical protein
MVVTPVALTPALEPAPAPALWIRRELRRTLLQRMIAIDTMAPVRSVRMVTITLLASWKNS